jgi:hypothetical protein
VIRAGYFKLSLRLPANTLRLRNHLPTPTQLALKGSSSVLILYIAKQHSSPKKITRKTIRDKVQKKPQQKFVRNQQADFFIV